MLTFLISEVASLTRMIQAASAIVLWLAFAPAALRCAEARPEPRIVALHGLDAQEVRHQGFSLPAAAKVHIYARGGAVRTLGRRRTETPFFAYGWLLNADTREVVWQMDMASTQRNWEYRIADQYLDLPQGHYEAYFANHGFAQSLLFAQWSRNIDRRQLPTVRSERPHGFLAALGADHSGLLRHWQAQVGNYGMEIYLPGGDASRIPLFDAPLHWRNGVIRLMANQDSGHWSQSFHLAKPATVHLYAEGEGSGSRLNDYGWIQEVQSRKRVWEMTADKAAFAGGARKNRRQVETMTLPAGDYEAHFITDDSHSPADWNAAPPCDPGLYGLTLALPKDGDLPAFSLLQPRSWTMLAELVRVGNDQDRRQSFTLPAAKQVRVLALGEADDEDAADEVWIEDATGQRVWFLDPQHSLHAGGARKNRMADELIHLPKGSYTLRVRTDGSHAYGDWNSAAPWDAEHYGITVYSVK
jgi:hypothetical protein